MAGIIVPQQVCGNSGNGIALMKLTEAVNVTGFEATTTGAAAYGSEDEIVGTVSLASGSDVYELAFNKKAAFINVTDVVDEDGVVTDWDVSGEIRLKDVSIAIKAYINQLSTCFNCGAVVFAQYTNGEEFVFGVTKQNEVVSVTGLNNIQGGLFNSGTKNGNDPKAAVRTFGGLNGGLPLGYIGTGGIAAIVSVP